MTNEHPEWPTQSTGAGMSLRMAEALGRPGRPRRAALLLLGLPVLMAMFVVLVLVLAG
jgi:hypothetical protein